MIFAIECIFYAIKSFKMKPVLLSLLFFFFINAGLYAQEIDSVDVKELDSIVVKAYEQNRRLQDVPAAVGLVNTNVLNRFGNTSIVSAMNTIPGLKMEERSPGSYRINLRGSALRSPFGVRNVKVYYNDLAFTDAGGNTYLNSLGFYNIQSIEIIKGPASSLYGAGTGGAVLISPISSNETTGMKGEYTFGSYGLQNISASFVMGETARKNKIGFQHQQSIGYRAQSKMERNIFSWDGSYRVFTKGILKSSFLYSRLFYQTPGALTINEYNQGRKAARPAAGGFPSAQLAKASIDQNSFFTGVSLSQPVNANITNKTSVYGAFTKLLNPAIRNYGKNLEPHVGGRSLFTFSQHRNQTNFIVTAGAEWQKGFSNFSVFKNRQGIADSLFTDDDVENEQAMIFLQSSLALKQWELTAGGSLNYLNIKFNRRFPYGPTELKRSFKNELAPRLALKRQFEKVNIYTSISKGFSPPTTAELLPTGSAINLDLSAEHGINYDAGVKGTFLNRFSFDINAFLFKLKNTIVQRRDAGGGDFYLNSGSTDQKGIESSFKLQLFKNPFVKGSTLWLNHTFSHFDYADFKQLNNSFSGNQIPGVARNVVSSGLDMEWTNKFSTHVTYYYSSRIALNDANNAYAPAYHLLGCKAVYTKGFSKTLLFSLSAGADNILNQKYSLGNDINAFGGRYYNAAPERNYFVTISVQWQKQSS